MLCNFMLPFCVAVATSLRKCNTFRSYICQAIWELSYLNYLSGSEQWRTVAQNILETTECRALFKDVVEFIERQVGILMDPLFDDIRDLPASMRPVNRPKLHPEGRVKGNIFATTVAPVESGETSTNMRTELPPNNSKVILLCVLC